MSYPDYTDVFWARYFPSQMLIDADFTQDQDFHRLQRTREDWLARTAGVAQGLTVQLGTTTIAVACGIAFDAAGNLVLVAPQETTDQMPPTLNPSRSTPPAAWSWSAGLWTFDFKSILPSDGSLYLYLQAAWTATDEASSSSSSPSSSSPSSSSSSSPPWERYQQTPIIDVAPALPTSGAPPIVLATFSLANGAFSGLSYTARLASGLNVSGPPQTFVGGGGGAGSGDISVGTVPLASGSVGATYDANVGTRLEIGGYAGLRLGFTTGNDADPITGVAPITSLLEISGGSITVDDNVNLFATTLIAPAANFNGLSVQNSPAQVAIGTLAVNGTVLQATSQSGVSSSVSTVTMPNITIEGGGTALQVSAPIYLAGNMLQLGDNHDFAQVQPVTGIGNPPVFSGNTGVSFGVGTGPTGSTYGLQLTATQALVNGTLSLSSASSKLTINSGNLGVTGNLTMASASRIASPKFNVQWVQAQPYTGGGGSSSSSGGIWANYQPLATATIPCHGGTLIVSPSGTFQSQNNNFSSIINNYINWVSTPQTASVAYWLQPESGPVITQPPISGPGPVNVPCRTLSQVNYVASVFITPSYWVIKGVPAGSAKLQFMRDTQYWGDAVTNLNAWVSWIELPF